MTIIIDVAKLVGVSPSVCGRIASTARHRYKKFRIPKRRFGEFRQVAQPAREVKSVQRAIVTLLSPILPIHEAATAYVEGSSILRNAAFHENARYLTKLDFRGFFPSIDAAAISMLLRASIPEISDDDVRFVLNACLWTGDGRLALCIGAPSSPFLSNAVMFGFDTDVSAFAVAHGCKYTRYSDDIALSAQEPDLLRPIEDYIRKKCREMDHPRLELNDEKRVAVGRGASMQITGLTLANQGGVTVGRTRKRGVRAGVNRFVSGALSLEEIDALKGEVAFVLSVEPEFRGVLLASYGPQISLLLPRS